MVINLESNKRPIIKGKVCDKDAYFLLDTGASISLIDDSKINKYKLIKGNKYPGTLVGAGGLLDSLYYCKNLVKIENKEIGQFILGDISQVRNSINRETGIEILGIISYPQMKFLNITIDCSHNKITLG